MAVRSIVVYPDPVLVRPTRVVESVDEGIRSLVRDMTDTMHAAPGIGLAANQVGEGVRVCVVDPSAGEEPGALIVLINPVVIAATGTQIGEEGCLSFPDITLDIERAQCVEVEAVDLEGRKRRVRGEGLLARVILHEIEHLDGHTFIRNVSSIRRELVKREIRKRMKAGEWVATATG